MVSTADVHPNGPEVYSEVLFLHENTGYFPLLGGLPISQGFSWGESAKNMAFKQHSGDPEVVIERNQSFLQTLGETLISNAVVIEAYADMPVIDVDHAYLSDSVKTDRGIFTPAHAVFTQIPGQTLSIKPGDCTASLVYGSNSEGPIIGIIHASRHELGMRTPYSAICYLSEAYCCDPVDIRIAVAPSLARLNHRIMQEDIAIRVQGKNAWGSYLQFHETGGLFVDMAGYLVSQYIEAGVPAANIAYYDVDTYTAADLRQSFSHRYATERGIPERNGRFMVAVRLREDAGSNTSPT